MCSVSALSIDGYMCLVDVAMTFVHAGAWSENNRKKLKKKNRLPLLALCVGSVSLSLFIYFFEHTTSKTTLGLWKYQYRRMALHTERLPNITIISITKISAYASRHKCHLCMV